MYPDPLIAIAGVGELAAIASERPVIAPLPPGGRAWRMPNTLLVS
jgi:hypothetical protein